MSTDHQSFKEPSFRLADYSHTLFGVSEEIVVEALLNSPNARGYIIGAVSELILRAKLEEAGLKVKRIKEKWEGVKIHHGDFYVSLDEKNWYVVESKGLKSNSEKWAQTGKKNFFNELTKASKAGEMKRWFDNLSDNSKKLLRDEPRQDGIRLCQTHMPSGKATNQGRIGGRTQASPRYDEFHLLAVDMYTKTGKHEFVYAISDKLARSKKDKNHLLQNYFISLVLPSSMEPLKPFAEPWGEDLITRVKQLENPVNPKDMQVDERKPGERAEGVLSF